MTDKATDKTKAVPTPNPASEPPDPPEGMRLAGYFPDSGEPLYIYEKGRRERNGNAFLNAQKLADGNQAAGLGSLACVLCKIGNPARLMTPYDLNEEFSIEDRLALEAFMNQEFEGKIQLRSTHKISSSSPKPLTAA